MDIPKIEVIRKWDAESVRKTCIRYQMYTIGTVEEYDAMLGSIKNMEPTPENIYKVAKDISEHSASGFSPNDTTPPTDFPVSFVMGCLEDMAVITNYRIEGEE